MCFKNWQIWKIIWILTSAQNCVGYLFTYNGKLWSQIFFLSFKDLTEGDKHILHNYRPIFLLPIWNKLFEKIIFDTIFQHLTVNKLLNPN